MVPDGITLNDVPWLKGSLDKNHQNSCVKMSRSIKRTSIRTETHTISVVFDQKTNGTPYVLREGRCFSDLPPETFECFSGNRLENPYNAKRQAVFRF